MSKDLGKKIKFLAVFIGIAGAIAGLIMAFISMTDENIAVLFAWIFISIAFLLLILPVYAVGAMMEEITAQRERIQILSDKLTKVSKSISAESPAEKFSPSGRMKIVKTNQTTTRPRVPTPQTPIRPNLKQSSSAEDYTRSLDSKTLADVPERQPEQQVQRPYERKSAPSYGTMSVEPSQTLKNAFVQSSSNNGTPFFTTTGLDTYEINRRINSVTKVLPNPSSTISAGGLHSAFVFSNGKVASVGYGTYGQCEVSEWRDIISVAAGNHHTVGLKKDGACVAAGYNGYHQCDVSEWTNICQIGAGFGHTVALREDGTCVATGDNAYNQCNVFDWTEIIAIVAGYNYTVGLKADGTLVAVGANTDGQWGAIKWGSISAVAAGGFHTIGLKNDGTCVAVGNNANDQCDVSRWTNVKAVAAGNYHTVALLQNGKTIATGYNGYGQCDVFEWQNVVAISAGRNHTLGLTADGRVLSAGDNTYGQCDTASLSGVKIIK